MLAESLVRFIEIVQIALHPNGRLNYLINRAASISSFNILIKLKKIVPDISSIIDVGANQGQFALAASRLFSNAVIHSFEPVPDSFLVLQQNLSKSSLTRFYNYGLGSKSGEINFYKNAHSHASSALPVSEFQKKEIPKTAQSTPINVHINTLDAVIDNLGHLPSPILLKLDVQGYEKEVLLGARDFIKRVDYLLFETSFVKMYEGEPLFDEMHEYVKNLGFQLIGPVGSLQSSSSQIMQMDMLYKRV
ncbi:FkbM family methyltransferase [Telluribacter sp.]|jgi:FkbM family methyltransferase|uniref:FkbM family methyltransferase n=1 Tax=Telluribacter sp. TaxID=1978767 RepID=UPI002E11250C|nr:FkbM family methyltransferase [Telluribacter sp.]